MYGSQNAAGTLISFYAFMTMPVPMLLFVQNTVSESVRWIPQVWIFLLYANAVLQGFLYFLFRIPFIDMLFITHLLLFTGVVSMILLLWKEYRKTQEKEVNLCLKAFGVLGISGVIALVLYWVLSIYWYESIFQFGILLYIAVLFWGLLCKVSNNIQFCLEQEVYRRMSLEDRMTDMKNRKSFEMYLEEIQEGAILLENVLLLFVKIAELKKINDMSGRQMGDETVIRTARSIQSAERSVNMTYNIDFLIAAMVILLLVLWYFLGQKRAEDLNNQVFLFFAIIGILDVVAELASNYYISFPNSNCEIAAMLATTIFYLLQALLPFTVICYIQTLHDNKIISAKKMFLSGVPTFILMGMILTNPFTEKLFYFDIPAGYMKGPWYMLMYYSALCHMAAALILIVIWRKKLGYQKVKSLLEILLISGAGVVIQLLYHPLLTTGFGMSLGILVLFITINNPHANIDTLTGLYNHLYLVRKSNELISAGKKHFVQRERVL